MVGLLRFVAFFTLLAGVLLFVALPALASPLLTQLVRDAGLRSDDLRVSIALFDPALLTGRSQRMRIEATNVALGPATASGLDLSLGQVELFEQRFETVRGNLRGVELSAGGLRLYVARVEIDGPADSATVTGHFSPDESAEVVRQAAARAGVTLSDVRMVEGGIRVRAGGVDTSASLGVEGGGLVLRPEAGPAVLLIQPAPSDPWRLTEAWVTRDGITIRGLLDARALVRRVTGAQ